MLENTADCSQTYERKRKTFNEINYIYTTYLHRNDQIMFTNIRLFLSIIFLLRL